MTQSVDDTPHRVPTPSMTLALCQYDPLDAKPLPQLQQRSCQSKPTWEGPGPRQTSSERPSVPGKSAQGRPARSTQGETSIANTEEAGSKNTRIKAQNGRKTVSSYVDRTPSVSVNRVVIQPRARQTTQKFRQQKQKGSMLQTRGNGCCMAVERTLLQRLNAAPGYLWWL